MKRWSIPTLILLLLLTQVLCSCSKQEPLSSTEGTLVLAGGAYDPPTLDPALANDSSSTFVVRQIFSGLVTLDQDLQVVPDLAERWTVSPDGRTYTFYLHPGARFHDGRPVTADDVIYSMERACDPALGPSLPCGTYLIDIVGVAEKLAGQVDQISGLQEVDQHTLAITVDAPKSYFLSKLTYNTAYVVDRANVEEGQAWTEQPNGSGPFRLAEWEHNRRIVMTRNEDFYRSPPLLTRVELLLGSNASQPRYLYEQGQIDYTEVGASLLAWLEYEDNPFREELRLTPELSLSYVGFNTQVPPLDDPKVRQALTMVIDRGRIARVTYEGRLTQARGILPPGIPGYDPNIEGLPYDPERARQLLAESRYGGPEGMPRIKLYTSGGGLAATLQQVYRAELGLEIELRQVEWADLLAGLDERRYAMFTLSWIADYADPQNFLEVLFHSGSPNNYAAYTNPDLDRLLEEAAVEQDGTRRMELYREAERLIVSDAAVIPVTHGMIFSLTKPYVRGLEITPLGLLDLCAVQIEGRP
jgi:peptide/nickel transport system substrate-binding protein/oligopeptide transport system substrate-binding protein